MSNLYLFALMLDVTIYEGPHRRGHDLGECEQHNNLQGVAHIILRVKGGRN